MKETKVLIYTDKWNNGGIEKFIMNVYNNIDSNKFKIDILVAQNESNLYDEEIKLRGGNIIQILQKKEESPIIRNIKNIFLFKKIIKNDTYDVIHINIGNAVGLIYAFFSKNIGIKKVIVHSHNSDVGKKNRIIKIIAHSICKYIFQDYATDYLACSDKAASWMYTSKVLSCKNVKIINNAIEIEKFEYDHKKREQFRKENGFEDSFVIGHIGRFNEQKNHEFLVEIFDKIQSIMPNSRLVLIGDGELKNKIKEMVINKNISNNVLFYGVTNEIQKCLSGFDAFVLPSLYEGNPIVGIEAQASGLYCFFSEDITKNAKVTDNVKFISLNESLDYWATEIVKVVGIERKNQKHKLIQAGYDIKSLVNNIEEIYSI